MKKYAWFLIGIIGIIELLVAAVLVGIIFPLSDTAPHVTSNTPVTSMPIPTLRPTLPTLDPYPSQVIDLSNWKLTMPFGSTKKPTRPLEVRQPDLATYKEDPWFTLTLDGKGVIFRAPVTGPTTSGTKYARSELREMANNGKTPANWSSTEGIHTMFLDQAITAVPKAKQHIVVGQIHDDNDDIIVIRLEYPNLYVNVNGKNVYTLDSHYTLGKRFTVELVVNEEQTKVYYNGNTNPSYTLTLDYTNAYFKTGAYTQSNCDSEGKSSLCSVNNYGEVVVYKAKVSHQ